MKKFGYLLTLSLVAGIFFVGCDKKESPDSLVSSKSLTKSIELTGVNGEKINTIYTGNGFKFAGVEEKAVLVVFFATWCPPCKAEIPHLVALQEKYNNEFSVIAVLLEEGKSNEEVSKFIAENKINYFVANSPANFEAAEAFGGVKGIPAMFMFDKNGNKTAYYPGATPKEIIEQDILKTLGKK